MEPSITVNYAYGISNHIDFMARLTGSFLRYPFRNSTSIAADDKFYTEADANINIKLLTDRFFVVPYLQAGIGAAQTQKSFMAQVPLGVGLQMKLGKNVFLNLNSNYRVPVTAAANYSLIHSIGILSGIVKEKPAAKPLPPPPPLPPADGDGDGVIDSLDLCPTVAGLPKFKGCPDTDQDGIQDSEDKCPTEPGLIKYNGCPIPDTDKDAINDELDKCPDVPGVERYEGCPVPDSDKDGLNDEEDKCPAQAGKVEEMGCPPVIYKFINIQFALGKSDLNAASKKELDRLSNFLNENTDVKVYLFGHADTTGSDERNVILSIERAQKTAAYLAAKGVEAERLNTQGFSSKKPIAPNRAKKGRQLNRRVEFALKRY
jgi:OOP family OmpA-OmpF porin